MNMPAPGGEAANPISDMNAAPVAEAASEAAPVSEGSEAGTDGAIEGGEAAPYSPNLKFKVMEQEHEIDKFFHGFIKDADAEKKFRELHEKAFGLDTVKGRLTETRETLQSTKSELGNYKTAVSDLRDLYKARDFDTFFQKLNIPQEDILQWVAEKVSYNELSPDQKAMYDRSMQDRREAFEARKQVREIGSQSEERSLEAKRVLLTSELAKPDVKTFADAYNAKVGKPNAFWEEVCKAGEYAYRTENGIDLPPQEAIKRVMDAYRPFVGVTETAAGNSAVPASNTPKVVQPNSAPTLPNVQGSAGRSPVGKAKPRSVEDLKKLANGQSL